MSYQIFNQNNYSEQLGTGTVGITLKSDGCAECDVASILVYFGKQTDPLKLNQDLISINGYADNGNGQHDLLDWTKISQLYPDVTLAFNNAYPSSPADMSLIDAQLAKNCPVVVGVSFAHDVNATQPSHYVVIYQKNPDGTYQCMDPYFGDDVVYNTRYAVNGMSVAQSILQAVSYNGTVASPGTLVDAVTFEKLVTNSSANDAVCDELGLTHEIGKDAEIAAIKQIKLDKANADTTITNLNKQIPDLESQLSTAKNSVDSLTQQLATANQAAQHPDTGLQYQDLYNQAETDLKTAQANLATLQQTYNRSKAQYSSTSALLLPKTQLFQILVSRILTGK